MTSYRANKPNFQELWDRMAKMTLKVRVNDPFFNTEREYPMMHVWCKVGDSRLNLRWVTLQTRSSLRTESDKDNTPLAWKARGKNRILSQKEHFTPEQLAVWLVSPMSLDSNGRKCPPVTQMFKMGNFALKHVRTSISVSLENMVTGVKSQYERKAKQGVQRTTTPHSP